MKRVQPRRIKKDRSYSVEEAAKVLGVHKNSIRGWCAKGLTPIDTSRPMLFYGDELQAFLRLQLAKQKRPCVPGTFFCFSCRESRRPALGMVEYRPINCEAGLLKALCEQCETVMNLRVKLSDLDAIMPGIDVQIRGAQPRLREGSEPLPNCDLKEHR